MTILGKPVHIATFVRQFRCLLADFLSVLPGKFWYMHKMKGLLEKNDVPTFLCEPEPGKDIVEVTKDRVMAAASML